MSTARSRVFPHERSARIRAGRVLSRPALWLVLVLAICFPTEGQVTPKPEHAASQLNGWKLAEARDDVLVFEAPKASHALLALHSRDPLAVMETIGGRARLRPGWNGTIEYSHYGLELSADHAGRVVVKLRRSDPPDKPQPTSEPDLSRFLQRLKQRTSRPPDKPEEFRAWQERHRAKLARALLGGALPERVPLQPRVVETKEYPEFTLRRVEYHSRNDRTNTLLLSLPKAASVDPERRAFPLLLALHGHEAPWGVADEQAYAPGHNDDFIAQFAQRGWAVLQPATMNHSLQHRDWTLQGEWTWDAMVALDYALTLPEVDPNRIGVCGLSTGGHLAMNVLALDPRVRAGVVGCVLSTWNHYERRVRIPPHCDCGIQDQLSSVLEEQCDWAALAAPKPVMFQHGREDAAFCPGADSKQLKLDWNTGILPVPEYQAMFAEVERAWRLGGSPNQVKTHFHNGPHRVDNEAAWEWLNHALECIPESVQPAR